MIRAISLVGFGGGFLMISPNLRTLVLSGMAAGADGLEKYSPWSYVACVVCGVLLFMLSLNRGSRAR